ncbi:Mobile element protein [Minicystis rosea]|nr:Mobile element protein [Minicystis rosea]
MRPPDRALRVRSAPKGPCPSPYLLTDTAPSSRSSSRSTRHDIQSHLEALYGTEMSPTLISSVAGAVYDELHAWRDRPLESMHAVIWLDARVIKVREQGVVQNEAAPLAIGQQTPPL